MKLTKKARNHLYSVLVDMERARRFLDQDRIVLATTKGQKTTTLDFELPDGRIATGIDKHIGSDLAGLDMAIRSLRRFLEAT